MAMSHQTVRLSAGRHRGPDDGACALELASMLAGEPFGDHPRSVCPVIAGFLRSYNDHVDDPRRQDLYVYAARVVGTRTGPEDERRRADMCLAWSTSSARLALFRRIFSWIDAPPEIADARGARGLDGVRGATALLRAAQCHGEDAVRFGGESTNIGCLERRVGRARHRRDGCLRPQPP